MWAVWPAARCSVCDKHAVVSEVRPLYACGKSQGFYFKQVQLLSTMLSVVKGSKNIAPNSLARATPLPSTPPQQRPGVLARSEGQTWGWHLSSLQGVPCSLPGARSGGGWACLPRLFLKCP